MHMLSHGRRPRKKVPPAALGGIKHAWRRIKDRRARIALGGQRPLLGRYRAYG